MVNNLRPTAAANSPDIDAAAGMTSWDFQAPNLGWETHYVGPLMMGSSWKDPKRGFQGSQIIEVLSYSVCPILTLPDNGGPILFCMSYTYSLRCLEELPFW